MPLVIIGCQEAIRAHLANDVRGVILIEPLTEADLPWVLHGADLALSPSPYEGFELPALESLTAAVP